MSDYAKIIADRVKKGVMTLEEVEMQFETPVFNAVKKIIEKVSLKYNSEVVAIEDADIPGKLHTIKEAASILKLKPSTVSAYIHAHKEFIETHVTYVEGRGACGKRLFIKKEGITFLGSIDWNSRKLRSPYKNDVTAPSEEVGFFGSKMSVSTKLNLHSKMSKVKSDLDALGRLEKLDAALETIYGQ